MYLGFETCLLQDCLSIDTSKILTKKLPSNLETLVPEIRFCLFITFLNIRLLCISLSTDHSD
jgi:hypothetical protein